MKAILILGGIIVVLAGAGLGILFFSPLSSSVPSPQLLSPVISGDAPPVSTSPSLSATGLSSSVAVAPRRPAGVPYKEIISPSGFVNTDGITMRELIGKKVVLVDFMTYSCINCQRTFPYMVAWYGKYKNQGLEIVGIHTPEFAFEKNIENVRAAMKKFGITYPVVLDNGYATWSAYGNRYWPRKYLVDIYGNIVYDHIGEGAYEETEMKIQGLLQEHARVLGEDAGVETEGVIARTMPPAPNTARSPETYFGSLRNEFLANNAKSAAGETRFELPEGFAPNALYLGGAWTITPEYAESVSEARVVYRYNAKEVYIVADAAALVEVEVLQDGKPVGASAGEDVKDGVLKVRESRLYKLIKNAGAGEHTLELRVRSKGLRAYAFTFG